MILLIRLLVVAMVAFFVGNMIAKIKLPSILGWLLTGMVLGPHAIGIMNNDLLNATGYQVLLSILEIGLGIMIGSELIFKDIKKSGKNIIVTTLFQSLTTFSVVTLFFGVIFYFSHIPVYLAFIFGGIALATAPAPVLSIVQEFKTNGPVTRTLIPMAALDDIVAIIVFFSTISLITAANTDQSMPLYIILAVMIVLPVMIGSIIGFAGGIFLKKDLSKFNLLVSLIVMILLVASVGFIFNNFILAKPVMNFMLIGLGFSTAIANIVPKEKLAGIMTALSPLLKFSLMMVILNLGAPLDYQLILGAGAFTAIYIISRALGKYSGAFMGAKLTKSPDSVAKYLGLTLLPHSGVSLVFTGIAAAQLSTFDPSAAIIVQGTIAAAAVINELIAVIVAKKAFEWAGELDQQIPTNTLNNLQTSENVI